MNYSTSFLRAISWKCDNKNPSEDKTFQVVIQNEMNEADTGKKQSHFSHPFENEMKSAFIFLLGSALSSIG